MQCPVLLADESCFPEIAGDAALYFKLNDEENTLTRLLDSLIDMDSSSFETLIDKQNVRLKKYSWQEAAKQLAELYEMVIKQNIKGL